jgi:four helix bundle protein
MGNDGRGFESLRVYRLAEDLSDSVWDIVHGWQNLARDTVGKQLVRAVDSVGANIAEGTGRGTYKDNCRFVDNARGPLCETRHWLRRAYRRKLLPKAKLEQIRAWLNELGPKLNAYRNSLKLRDRAKARK